MSKISLPILLTIMCVFMAGVLGLAYVNKGYLSNFSKSKSIETEEVKITRKILDWIDEQRDEGGFYLTGTVCSGSGFSCDKEIKMKDEEENGLLATWARFMDYQQNKNSVDFGLIKGDIKKYLQKYENGEISGLWTCKIMYDMSKSDFFDEKVKGEMEEVCLKNSYIPVEKISSFYDENGSTSKVFDGYPGITSDLVAKYLWLKNESDLVLARDYLREAERNYEFKMITKSSDICLLGISALDLYKIDHEEEEIQIAEKIYNNEIESTDEIIRQKFLTPTCGLFLKNLYGFTGDKKYSDRLEGDKQKILNGFWGVKEGQTYFKYVSEHAILLLTLY